MVFGRLIHFTFDALALSTILAGVKKTTGFSPATDLIPDSSIKSITDSYLGAGTTIFDIVSGQVVTSQYFKRS
ncbi:hypothetical protein I307_02408 [Cryptococcus deuterogattii 99/473]|uniref:Unplaced genomic scaffold supercont1.16, whole genome shotgun sequence n=2 Tax=Cryptococcus deuterogattii TaxID=1859096 RepID=A0A0D0SYI6_9TREE|nr:hypothetical protein CNBG_5275 [Cryptococcus deuterogattii R265]KIR29007.1 hypothetical protein I309_02049 [Cryptococcus deuterogattii LA55]KIR34802.1 hypothetical protein I352_03054 [Cryptococcus deuterogattii MMRL2647]KIR38262.1 hypothetical protein I313_05835 [Cryptococcus deuterogattii Ram5]KIR73600.1 hypothetical protein I310_02272 [Cryptococcus deuterogattii CA1014]KIR93089.1 hypothetical protein I304_02752 [Cryptococcus deuterogattii CBS 10090]KIR99647.1 hypothetical protein L804_03